MYVLRGWRVDCFLPILWEQGECWTCVSVLVAVVWVGSGLGPESVGMGWCYVCVSMDYMCRWQVQVSVYCAWRIHAHLRCTQCSILLHLMDICFLTCICLWQISQIQTCLFKVVGPRLVSTSPAFVSSSASHPSGPHAPKTVNRAPLQGVGKFDTICTVRCDSSTACRPSHLEPFHLLQLLYHYPRSDHH